MDHCSGAQPLVTTRTSHLLESNTTAVGMRIKYLKNAVAKKMKTPSQNVNTGSVQKIMT